MANDDDDDDEEEQELCIESTGRRQPPPSDYKKVSDFELSVGKALDTLRNDYPDLLTQPPDYSLYDKNVEVIDPSGVRVHGLQTYKNSFRVLHAVVKVIYCPDRSEMRFRMCFDKVRSQNDCGIPFSGTPFLLALIPTFNSSHAFIISFC